MEIMMDNFLLNALARIGNVDQNEMSVIVDRLVDVYHPLQIYLFGSYAWGTPSVESDYDLCVIVESSGEKKNSRSRKGRNALLDIICRRGIDLIVYTMAEFDRAASHPSTLASPIKSKGVLLYDRIPSVNGNNLCFGREVAPLAAHVSPKSAPLYPYVHRV